MSGFIARQPNGLLCRCSHVVDCPTHYNMTDEEFLSGKTGNVSSREEAQDILDNHIQPFEAVLRNFAPNNMLQEEFDRLVELMSEEPMKIQKEA